MASDNPPVQIGLRLYPAQLEALDTYCTERGLDRTSAVRMAITRLLEGTPAAIAPVATSGGSGVDQPARDALKVFVQEMKKLKDRIEVLEMGYEETRTAFTEMQGTQKEVAKSAQDVLDSLGLDF